MGKPELDREVDMRRQHEEFSKEGYDGHNRRSNLITMRDLGIRRMRRIWNVRMRHLAIDWNSR